MSNHSVNKARLPHPLVAAVLSWVHGYITTVSATNFTFFLHPFHTPSALSYKDTRDCIHGIPGDIRITSSQNLWFDHICKYWRKKRVQSQIPETITWLSWGRFMFQPTMVSLSASLRPMSGGFWWWVLGFASWPGNAQREKLRLINAYTRLCSISLPTL